MNRTAAEHMLRPLVDIDMGVGRSAYEDPVRRYDKLTWQRNNFDAISYSVHGDQSVCHPYRVAHARGMCLTCYVQWRKWIRRESRWLPKALRELGIGKNGRDEEERLA